MKRPKAKSFVSGFGGIYLKAVGIAAMAGATALQPELGIITIPSILAILKSKGKKS